VVDGFGHAGFLVLEGWERRIHEGRDRGQVFMRALSLAGWVMPTPASFSRAVAGEKVPKADEGRFVLARHPREGGIQGLCSRP